MRQYYSLIWSLLLVVFISACASQKKSSTATQSSRYSEDLAVWRPKVEALSDETTPVKNDDRKQTTYVEPRYTVNKKLDAVLDSINRINLSRKFIDGYTIQVYAGLKREEALNTKKQLTTALPDLESEVYYVQPNFRVKAGKYLNQIDAQKDFIAVKKVFPSSVIVPDKIAIN